MNEILFQYHHMVITPWKLVGLFGAFLFTSRWFVQMYITRKLRRVHMPASFWWLSIAGSLLMLAYFTLGKNDSVGIISNLFPMLVAGYNLVIELRHRRNSELLDPN